MGAQDIDMILVSPDLGILRGHLGEAFVPIRHRVDDAIGLGGRGDVPFRAGHGEFEGIFQNAVHALAAEDALL